MVIIHPFGCVVPLDHSDRAKPTDRFLYHRTVGMAAIIANERGRGLTCLVLRLDCNMCEPKGNCCLRINKIRISYFS